MNFSRSIIANQQCKKRRAEWRECDGGGWGIGVMSRLGERGSAWSPFKTFDFLA